MRDEAGVIGGWLVVAGAVSLIAFGLHLVGVTVPLLLGISVGFAGILGAAMGYLETRASHAGLPAPSLG